MYIETGHYPEAQRFQEVVGKLSPPRSSEGYGTTGSVETIQAFRPLLCTCFTGEWTYAICAVVWQNGTIPPHQDGDTQTQKSIRYHLVIDTNPDAWVMHGGHWQRLAQDMIYTMDPLMVHAAVNWGARPRIHLVVDVRRVFS